MAPVGTVFDSATVVIKGQFAPTIFSPAWLLGKQLIGNAEYGDSEVDIINRDVAQLRCGWLRLHCRTDALQVSTEETDEFGRLRDLAAGVLQSLPDTPVGVMGINRAAHIAVDSVTAYHAIGDTLAPKQVWTSLKLPGMRSLTMQGVRPDKYGGWILVRVEPSVAAPGAVFIEHNDHYSLTHVDGQPESRDDVAVWDVNELSAESLTVERARTAIEILKNNWDSSIQRSDDVLRMMERLGREGT
jgi:hypothetical protein